MYFDALTSILVARIPTMRAKLTQTIRQSLFIFTLTALTAAPAAAKPQMETVNLSPSKDGHLRRVNVKIEVKGDLLVQPPEQNVRRLALLAKGNLQYDERLTPRTALRYYRDAQADIVVSGGSVSPRLDIRRRLVAIDLTAPRPILYSPLGPLSREQLELLDVQGSSAVVDRILPGKAVRLGESWSDSNDALAALLALDVVHQSDVSSTLAKIADGVAVVEFSGRLSGAVEAVPSEIQINGTYAFDLQARRITSLALAVGEKRPIGSAEPGFDVSARIEVLVDPLSESSELGDAALAALPESGAGEASLLALDTAGSAFRLLHGRRWRLIGEDEKSAVLRLVDHGDIVAQCNVHRLADLKDSEPPTLEQFHQDVKKSLDKNYGRLVDSEQTTTPAGLRLLRVAVEAEISEVPVRWNYFHLSDSAGRQATCVFTLQQANLERLGGDDMQIAGSLVLRGNSESDTSAEQPAGQNTAAGPQPTSAKTSRRTAGTDRQ